jgi:hypothetical protein
MVRMFRFLAAAFGVVACLTCAHAITLVKGGEPKAAIVAPPEMSGNLAAAVADLHACIERMSGAQLPITSEKKPGSAAIMLRTGAAGLSEVGYRLRIEGDDAIIEAKTPEGLANGIYGLLEDHLGVHWYVPGPLGEHVPRRTTIRLDGLDETREPAIPSVTGFGGYQADPPKGQEWARRNRLSGFRHYSHGHNWNYIISPDEVERHPEWFGLMDGVRKEQLCTTNPEVIRIAKQRVLEYFERNPQAHSFSLSPNDSDKFCECERCRALDAQIGVDPFAPGGQFTDRLVYFFNQIAEEVAKRYPDKVLCFYAYLTHTDPPLKVKPLPNLMPVICHTPWEFCHAHPITAECAPCTRFRHALVRWRELCPHVGIYDYYGHWEWFGQWPLVHTLRVDIPFCAKVGIEHLNSETHDDWWTQPLNIFITPKLVWNPGADVDALVHGFCANLFGPAGEPVEKYFALYEKEMAGIPLDAYRNHEDWMSWPSAALMEQGRILLAEAASRAKTPQQRERVRKMQLGHEVFTLQWQAARGRRADRMIEAWDADLHFLKALEELGRCGQGDIIDMVLAFQKARLAGDAGRAFLDLLSAAGYDTAEKREEALRASQADPGAFADSLGFVREWQVVGPFVCIPGKLANADIPMDKVDLSARYPGLGRDVGWQQVATKSAFGVVNLRDLLSKAPWVGAYAACWVRLPSSSAITLRLGSNDGAGVWLDGRPLVVSDVMRKFMPDTDRVSLVGAGSDWHLLMVKVMNHDGEWKFAVRFADHGGRPVAVASRPAPPARD